MKENWTRDQLIVALHLYWQIPYNQISGTNNKRIQEIAPLIGRSSGALAFILMQYTSLDTTRQEKGEKGKRAPSELGKEIWEEYFGDWEKLAHDSTLIVSKWMKKPFEELVNEEYEQDFPEGKENERSVKTRLNQSDFRRRILASYNNTCCITGLQQPEILIAGHIRHWSIDKENRLNPRNGIAINALHDKAFEIGLITITPSFTIKLSSILLRQYKLQPIQDYFMKYEDQPIFLPSNFPPDIQFLEWHNINKFKP